MEPALVQGARAIADPPAALKKRANGGVGFKALELLERAQIGITVVKPDNKPDRNLPLFEVVEKRSAIGRGIERPTNRVDDKAGLVPRWRDLPQLFDADRIGLWVDPVAQMETLDKGLCQRPAATFGEQRFLRHQLDTGLIPLGRLASLANPHIAGSNPAHPAVAVIQHLSRSKTGIDLDPQLLGLLREPTAQIAEADDVITVIVHLRRRRQPERARLRQQQKAVLARRRRQWCAALAPIRDQLVQRSRLEHRAR